MKDLIEILVARAAGLEVALAPSVGSLYDPASGSDWDRSWLDEVLDAVVAPQRPDRSHLTKPSAFGPIPAPAAARSVEATMPAAGALPAPGAPTASPKPPRPKTRAASPVQSSRPVSRTFEHARARVEAAPERGPVASPPPATASALRPQTARSATSHAWQGQESASGETPRPGEAVSPSSAGRSSAPSGPAKLELSDQRPAALTEPTLATAGATLGVRAGGSSSADGGMETVGETVVNVTIGRVELRAVMPAARPQPGIPTPKPFPSLEEYLERTSEGRA